MNELVVAVEEVNSATAVGGGRPNEVLSRATSKPSTSKRTANAAGRTHSVIKRLRGARGATVDDIIKMTGWQTHSVRGFLSGTVRKKLGLQLVSEPGRDGVRRYRIIDTTTDTNG